MASLSMMAVIVFANKRTADDDGINGLYFLHERHFSLFSGQEIERSHTIAATRSGVPSGETLVSMGHLAMTAERPE